MLLDAKDRKKSPRRTLTRVAVLTPFVIALLFLVRMPLAWTDQAMFSGLLIIGCVVVGRLSDSRLVTSALALVSIFATLRYFVWRWTSSIAYLNHSGWHVEMVGLVFALLLLCAETYSVGILLLGYFQSARPLKRRPAPMPSDTSLWPTVDVYIPTYNEPLEVVRPTVLAALSIDWPQDRLNVYVLDDGRRPQFQEFAVECGVGYLTRFDNFHAKAGNINSALKKTKGEYIAIFDCDHIATRSFLQLTMGWFFKDKRLAMVQTPHHFYSPDPFERNLNVFRTIPNEGALFYGVVQDGNDLWNASFFCGSCAVIKREALEEVGGIAVETVTEDAHTALRLQRRGWNTAYIGIPQAAGLATGSLAAHVGQRIRWARGMIQILRTECPLFVSGLRLPQRLCYFNCVIHYLYAIPRLIFVSAPLVYLLVGKSNLYGLVWEILAYAAPHLVLSSMVNSRSQGDHRHSFWNEVYEMVLAPYILLPTTFALINPKWGKFNVTAKTSLVDESFFDWKIARPYLALLSLNLVGIVAAVPRYFMERDSSGVLFVNVAWAVLNSLMLGACIAASFERKQRRSTARVEAPLTATLIFAGDNVHHCQVIDLSEGGLALRSERVLDCQAGALAEAKIRLGEEEFRFPVETVRTRDNRVHLRFRAHDLKHQKAVTKIIYGRADSWLDWTKDQRRDRIMGSLVTVLGIGAKGIWTLPSLLIKRESKGPAKSPKSVLARSAPTALLLLVFLSPSLHLHAQSAVAPPSRTDSALPLQVSKADPSRQLFEDVQTFSDLGHKSALILNNKALKASFGFVIPGTKIVDTADLMIRYQAAGITASDNVEVGVFLNEVEINSLQVRRSEPAPAPVHVSLPADLLVHDNALSFELRRRCGVPCKQSSDQFWVRVDAATQLRTSGEILRLPNRLSLLPSPFFDPSVHHSVDIPFVFESQPDLQTLKAAGVLASWFGSMAAYRGSHFSVSIGHFPKGNVVLLSQSNSQLATALGLSGAEDQIAICDNPSDRYGKVLALFGRTGTSLLDAAQSVASRRLTEDTDRLALGTVDKNGTPAVFQAPSWLNTAQPLRIARDLDANLLHARIGSPTNLYFRIPPDLSYGTNTTVPLHLVFRLAGLSGEDHAWIAIRLNNTFVAKRRVGAVGANRERAESFAVPVSLLYPSNTLTIELLTNRSDTSVADAAAVDLQILPSTVLNLLNPTRLMRMPRLDLFAASGYPFTSRADGDETAVIAPEDMTAEQAGLFLDAMGFLSAQTGVVASKFNLVHPRDASSQSDRNLLVIASANNEDTVRRFEPLMAVIPSNGKFELGESALPWQDWLSRAWLGRREELQAISTFLDRGAAPTFLLEQFFSPFSKDRSVLVIATRTETDDEAYFGRLTEASREGLIHGGVALADNFRFVSFGTNSGSFVPGRHASIVAVYDWLQFHLWILPVFLLAGALLVAYEWELLLDGLVERRLGA